MTTEGSKERLEGKGRKQEQQLEKRQGIENKSKARGRIDDGPPRPLLAKSESTLHAAPQAPLHKSQIHLFHFYIYPFPAPSVCFRFQRAHCPPCCPPDHTHRRRRSSQRCRHTAVVHWRTTHVIFNLLVVPCSPSTFGLGRGSGSFLRNSRESNCS